MTEVTSLGLEKAPLPGNARFMGLLPEGPGAGEEWIVTEAGLGCGERHRWQT